MWFLIGGEGRAYFPIILKQPNMQSQSVLKKSTETETYKREASNNPITNFHLNLNVINSPAWTTPSVLNFLSTPCHLSWRSLRNWDDATLADKNQITWYWLTVRFYLGQRLQTLVVISYYLEIFYAKITRYDNTKLTLFSKLEYERWFNF